MMHADLFSGRSPSTRRGFLRRAAGTFSVALLPPAQPTHAEGAPETGPRNQLAFAAEANQYVFHTGALRGTLRAQGRSRGLLPVEDVQSGQAVARGAGIFSHYRLLDDHARYGHAGWDWASDAGLREDGAVEVRWTADDQHPFDMTAVYRWSAPETLDLTTSIAARQGLRRLEIFLASYFEGFSRSLVYVKHRPDSRRPGFLDAKKDYGIWQMYPRDDRAIRLIRDGRWQRPPNPVQWQIMPHLAAPLAMRQDPATGLVGLVMAPPEDCFAVATPYGEEGHRSLYLSLLGGDLAAGATATARARLVIDRGISPGKAVALLAAYQESLANQGRDTP